KSWDICREVPVVEDEQTPWKMIKLLKIITLIVITIIVFGLALCSKASFLLLITLANEGTKTIQDDHKPVVLLCIGCSLITSSVILFTKSIWKACYKTSKLPRKETFALVMFMEFVASGGAAILTIVAMPHLDIVTNVTILNSVAILPAILQVVTQCTAKERNRFLLPSITAFILILLGYVLFLFLYIMKDPTDIKMIIWVGLAVGGSFLVSFNWWENYLRPIGENSKSLVLRNLCRDIIKCRNILHILSSLLRIAVTACVLGAYVPLNKMDWDVVRFIPRRETTIIGIIIGVQLISSALCHWFSLLSCKMHAIRRCFILPLYLAYLCATMWHETYDEMTNIIISIFRLDKYRPRTEQKFDDFTFEAHIYFDDAFKQVEGSQGRHLNDYAKSLVEVLAEVYIFTSIDDKFFIKKQQIPEQKVIRTPYGGRLVVTMPNGNNIIAHFKDKELIRHKKRWSQIMYLYYLLGWKLMTKYYKRWENGEDDSVLKAEVKREKQNTYLLALDGDTDFQPAAVMYLIDRLKMYPRVGAACGRIHPTGSPAVWFQKFEYAVSHWLQKTAEHVIGCVLCSPGCFSLFRAEALMDDNVMKRYATKSMEASHYIQYDQRRRWGPSTMANVVDLLGSSTVISKRNPSMSKPFMFYQLFNITSAILAPATICLLIASLSFVLNMDASWALILAVIPPIIYLILCFKLKSDTQITIAGIMSIIYAFLMLVVTMSIIGAMVRDKTILTPSSIFVVSMAIIYITTAVLHPQEIQLVFHGFLYIICIPSAYLLLTIYSMVNMNNVSWGTREDEEGFWRELQKKYLEPLADDKERQKQIINDLRELRNKINFAFFILNALWLVATFTLQRFGAFIFIVLPKVDFDLNNTGENVQIDPIGFMFILGFATSVLIQFFAMMYHIYTLVHYVAFIDTEPREQKPDEYYPPAKKFTPAEFLF
uniref:chitin synthase n=1 Tax=Labrus bergylta TaxID=56723 RepID=A0A3Q3N780_9LABR